MTIQGSKFMSLNWPTYAKQEPNNQTDPVGNAVNVMVSEHRAQAAANMRQLQAARAAEAKRQRQESLDAARVLDTDFRRE
jgi:hypothetical protein